MDWFKIINTICTISAYLFQEKENYWEWTNGWPSKYMNWGSDPETGENCTIMTTDSKWESADCNQESYQYVCRWSSGELL